MVDTLKKLYGGIPWRSSVSPPCDNGKPSLAVQLIVKPISRLRPLAIALTATALLAGCASFSSVKINSTQAEVRASLGAPTTQTKTATGERWAYSTAPEGLQVWILEFDSAGKLVSNTQGLTFDRAQRVRDGDTQEQVEALLGPSYWSLRYPDRPSEITHVYRFNQGVTPMCFFVGYDAKAIVTSTAMQQEERTPPRPGRPC